MTRNEFASLCQAYTINPYIALEDEKLCVLLKSALFSGADKTRAIIEYLRDNF